MSTSGYRRRSSLGVWLLVIAAYFPALTAAPGRMPTDTKLYLYLNPGRLIADAPFTWDVRQFAGWVPHQTIAYLWPSGPWFWTFDRLGVPDWVAHRLWIGTIVFLAGLGVRWAARHLGLGATAATVAGLVYALSPYLLPYISRTSVMLLPWAGLGWLVGLTVRAALGRTRWSDAALFALVVLTVGAVNATALALVAPGPVLWLLHAAWARLITWKRAAMVAVQLGALSLAVSMWWIVMLVVQGRHGADVLAFSETLEAVSLTSVSTETLRGLGYWLFYVRDPYAFTTTAMVPYLTGSATIIAGYALAAVCLAGLASVRWGQRRYAALLVVSGIVLAVGVHPISDPSPLMDPLADSALGLALRSSTRALPLAVLGMALGAGALVGALGTTRFTWRALAAPTVVIIALVNLPAWWQGGFVDPALERDQDVPWAWQQAVAALERGSSEYRVLQLPGSEFGAFRWGYTVDPPLPGLTTKPLVTRDLLPLGSPGAMDLLYALDNRFQAGTVEPTSLAPVARLLGVDTIWVANDLAFDRFRTPRPEVVADLFAARPAGLGAPIPFGEPAPNVADVPMVDEQALADPRVGGPLAPVALVSVEDPVAVVRAATEVVLLSGSGDGIVDAAAAGLLRGDELVRYSADLDDEQRATALAAAEVGTAGSTRVVITDSNRDRAAHWRGSQDVVGFTERGGPDPDVTRFTSADQRLAVFATTDPHQQTVALLDDGSAPLGGFSVRASAYGEPFAYRPEDRPSHAVDANPGTAWVVADRADPVGESIEVSATAGYLQLLQPQDPVATRMITRVEVAEADRPPQMVDLDERSLAEPGQRVELAGSGPVTITIAAVAPTPDGSDSGPSAVGFAELGPRATEVVVVPSDLLARITPTTRLALVLSRDRVRSTDRWRDDPEAALVREFTLPVARTFEPRFTLRLDERADDRVLAALRASEPVAAATTRLAGVPGAGARSAVDADPTTAWTTAFGGAVGSTLTVQLSGAAPVDRFDLVQPVDPLHSTITELQVTAEGVDARIAVAPPDAAGRSTVVLPAPMANGTGEVALTITAVDARTTVDRRFGEVTELPAAITELTGLPLATAVSTAPASGCRTDLVAVDGTPLGVELDPSSLAQLLAGDSVEVGTCAAAPLQLAAGTHRLVTNGGRDAASGSGIDVDRVVLRSSYLLEDNLPQAGVITLDRTRTTRTATLSPCPQGCWLVLGEGFNPAWRASVESADGTTDDLGAPQQVSGGFNGWYLPPSNSARTVTAVWQPQAGLDIALLVASSGVLACVALALVDRRRRALAPLPPPHWDPIGVAAPRSAVLTAALAVVAGAAVLIAPEMALPAAGAAVGVTLVRRPRLLAWAAAALTATLGAWVLFRQRRNRWSPDAAWPGAFEDLHRWGVLVVVLLLAACLASDSELGCDHELDQPTATDTTDAARNESLTQ